MYDLYKTNNANIYLIKNKKFKTISLSIQFRKEKTKYDSVYLSILKDVLNCETNEYKNLKDYHKAKLNIYDPFIEFKIVNSGKNQGFVIDSKFANEKYTEKGMNKKTIEFIFNTIYNPKTKNKSFDKENFEIAKQNYIEHLKAIKDNPFKYTSIRLWEEINVYDFKILTNKEAIEKAKQITEKTLYEYYETLFTDTSLDIFIIGDFNNEEIKKTISSIIKGNFKKSKKNTFINHKEVKKENQIIETSKTNQSQLGIGLKFLNLTEFEKKYVSILYTSILGGGWASKLMQKVREEKSLCYFIGASRSITHGLCFIYASIDAKNYEKVLTLIKKEIESMQQGDFTEKDISRVQQVYLNSLLEIEDNQIQLMNSIINIALSDSDSLSERKENITKISKEDIINIAKKVKIDTIFFLKGEKQSE